ncbi:MAG: hypothetical protein HOO93_14200 [Methyloglobulus sp.]|nr:hypothetical protein [Methyloglobulus sp.]
MNTTTNKKTRIVAPTLLLIGTCVLVSGSALAAYATTSQLTAETNARKAADNTEKNARIAADNSLKTQLTAEQTARQDADATLTTNLATEKNDREQSDIALGNAYKQDLQAAIIQLEARISALSALIPSAPANPVRPKQGLTLKLCPGSDTPQWENCTYAIGDTGPAGGIVFYLTDTTGLHGLEAAPVDLGPAEWGCSSTAINGADNHDVGSGAQNTLDILTAGCTYPGIAARLADDYSLNDHDDWYLPSIDDLYVMSNSIGPTAPAPLANAGHFADGLAGHWSSSEYGSFSAWSWNFISNSAAWLGKNNLLYVRPVRTF